MRVITEKDGGIVPRVRLVDDAGELVGPVCRFLSHLGDREFSPNTMAAYAYDLKYLFTFLEKEGLDWQDGAAARFDTSAQTCRGGPAVQPDQPGHPRLAEDKLLQDELELGHCLRTPAEGPCECDLYLRCPKFFTTSEYAPRLQARLARERQLIQDAVERGWPREAERHTAISGRICELLTDLGEAPAPCEGDS